MSWDEVAYALNSRVKGDASNMKSLDVLIDEIKALNAQMQTTLNTVNSLANTINTTVNAVKTETAKNNTANATGTLSQKMTQVNNTVNAINSLASKGLKPKLSYKTITKHLSGGDSAHGVLLLSLSNIILYGLNSKVYVETTQTSLLTSKRLIFSFGSLGDYTYSGHTSNNTFHDIYPYVAYTGPAISSYDTPTSIKQPIFLNSLTATIDERDTYFEREYYINLLYAQL